MLRSIAFFVFVAIIAVPRADAACNPWVDKECHPVGAVDVVVDYMYYLGKSGREKIEIDTIYDLFSSSVKKNISKKKLHGLLQEVMDSSFALNDFVIDPRPLLTDKGEAVCQVTVHFTFYPSGVLTFRSMNVHLRAVYEEGEWKLAHRPTYKRDFNYQGIFQ